ncbi:MAG: DUF3185 family protein [Planctomycetota bacterium]|nr:MAG: DUF3185 family protein [Planctomycetota bacterium]
MLRIISIALIACGALLIFWGFGAQESIQSQISEFFTGTPSESARWYLLLGIAALVAGVLGLYSSFRSR